MADQLYPCHRQWQTRNDRNIAWRRRRGRRAAIVCPNEVRVRDQRVCFCPALLDVSEIDVLIAELDRVLVEEPRDDRFILERDGVTVRTIANLHHRSVVYDHLVHHPVLLETARTLLDDDVYVFQLGVNCKAAFTGDAWFWHQDYPGYREDDHISEPRMVNTLIFLDEVLTTNGPLMLVPGSHRHVAPTPKSPTGGRRTRFVTPTPTRSSNR